MAYGSWYDHVRGWWEKKQEKILYLFYEDMKKVRVGWRGRSPGCPPSFSGSLLMSTILQDPRREVQKILHFLGKELAEGTVDRILHHTSFQEMKKNPAANYETMFPTMMNHSVSPFLRKGGVRPVVEDLGGMSLDCISAPICGCKYFMCEDLPHLFSCPQGSLETGRTTSLWPRTSALTSTTRSIWRALTFTSRWRCEGLIPLPGRTVLLLALPVGRVDPDGDSCTNSLFPVQ